MDDATEATRPPDAGLRRGFQRSRAALLAAAVAVAIVGCDLLLASRGREQFVFRLLSAFLAVSLYGVITEWDWASLGIRWRPLQGWGYWLKFAGKLGAVVVFLLMVPPLVLMMRSAVPEHAWVGKRLFLRPSDFWTWAPGALLAAPIAEEAIYRLVLCPPTAAIVGRRGAIVLSGAAFAALHFAYGNPGPDNVVAGFILAWAFLKSGSLVLPIAFHFLGNLLVGVYHLVLCYLNL